MYTPDCKAYQRHDSTAQTKKIRLSEKYWSLIAEKQAQIAQERGVKHVSRPVALKAILDEAFDVHLYDPTSLIDDSDDDLNYCYNPEQFND